MGLINTEVLFSSRRARRRRRVERNQNHRIKEKRANLVNPRVQPADADHVRRGGRRKVKIKEVNHQGFRITSSINVRTLIRLILWRQGLPFRLIDSLIQRLMAANKLSG